MNCQAVYTRTSQIIKEAKAVWKAIGNGDSTTARTALDVIEAHLQALRAEIG